MDTIRLAIEPLEGYTIPERHLRVWVNEVELRADWPGSVGGDPSHDGSSGAEKLRTALTLGGDAVVLRCYCGDEFCGLRVATVHRDGDRVQWVIAHRWMDWDVDRDLGDGWQEDPVATYEFDAPQYDAALADVDWSARA